MMFKNLKEGSHYVLIAKERGKETVSEDLTFGGTGENTLMFISPSGKNLFLSSDLYIQTTIVTTNEIGEELIKRASFKEQPAKNLKLVYILSSLLADTVYIFEKIPEPKVDLKNLILGEKYVVVTKGLGGNHHSFKGVLMGRKDGLLFEGNGTLVIRYDSIERLIIHEDDSVLSPLLLPQIGVNEESFNNPVYEFLVDGKYIMVLKQGKQIEVQKLTVK